MANGNGLHIKAAWRSLSLSDMRLLPNVATDDVQYYFTGKPCKNGHATVMYSKTRTCCECACNYQLKTAANKKFRAKVKPKISCFGIAV